MDEHFAEFHISRGLYQALFSLAIIDTFQKLPYEFLLGSYEEGVLVSSGVTSAAKILREKADSMPQRTYNWLCSTQVLPEQIEHRIKVDTAVLKPELIALADFLNEASSHKYDVQLWL